MPELLIADANPILAALLGGRAREVLFSDEFSFCSAQTVLFEVAKYLPQVAKQLELSELHVYQAFQLLPIEPCQPTEYQQYEQQAEQLIAQRDPLDVPTLALALARQVPIWSNDKDFQGIPNIKVFQTAELLERLA